MKLSCCARAGEIVSKSGDSEWRIASEQLTGAGAPNALFNIFILSDIGEGCAPPHVISAQQ